MADVTARTGRFAHGRAMPWLLACVFAIALVAAIAMHAVQDHSVAQRESVTPAAKPTRPSAVQTSREPELLSAEARAAQHALLPDGPLVTTHDTLVDLAQSGNAEAALGIAIALRLCEMFEERPRTDADAELVDLLARFTPESSDHAFEALRTEAIVRSLDMKYATCAGLADSDIDRSPAARRAWLERAANLGHPLAMVEVANELIAAWRRRGDIIDGIDRVRDDRNRAMGLLQRAALAGEPAALLRLSTAHRSGDLASIDAVAAYAYLLVYRDGQPLPEFHPQLFERLLDDAAAVLSTEQRAEAARRADAIRDRCCSDA